MFTESGVGIEAPKKVDLHGSTQAAIDEMVDSEIERLDSPSEIEGLAPDKMQALELRCISSLLQIDASQVRYTSGGRWEIQTAIPEGKRTLYVDIEETNVSSRDGSVTFALDGHTLTTWREYNPTNKEEKWRKHVTFTASPERLRLIQKRQQDRENEYRRKEVEHRQRRQELLPSVFAFVRAHEGQRLSAEKCEPIREFMSEFTGGSLPPDAELDIRLQDDSRGVPTCRLTTYKDGVVYDVAEFSER